MKTEMHKASERGKGEHGWLSSRFSFSFADWYDPRKMGFGALRVLNDDKIAPASGFPPHAHRDMEIITIVMKGVVTHEDDMGNKGEVKVGEVQVMSAGTGVTHAEYNHSTAEPLELFQLWITSDKRGHASRYDQRTFPNTQNAFRLLVSGDASAEGRKDGPLFIHQDAYISRGNFYPDMEYTYSFRHSDILKNVEIGKERGRERRVGRGAYLFVIEGSVGIGGETLGPRDAIAICDTPELTFKTREAASLLLIDVPMAEL